MRALLIQKGVKLQDAMIATGKSLRALLIQKGVKPWLACPFPLASLRALLIQKGVKLNEKALGRLIV